jgi:hypothetical protein
LVELSDEIAVVNDPSSPMGFNRVRQWIANCTSSHSLCQSSSSPLPKRVIDVGPRLGCKEIHLSESKGERQPYIALSHCWGPPELHPLKTLQRNYKDRCLGIDWEDLNKTFQDAIIICQELGIRYLWIDSLCIVQDDDEDWRDQSGQMSQIYRDAYLTISAIRAASGIDGCFSNRPSPKALYNGVVVREVMDHSYWRETRPHHSNNNPILLRGWCLQERLLSTRVLHYSAEEMVWECSTQLNCECGGAERKTYSSWNAATNKQNFNLSFPWKRIVEDYTTRKLSKYNDILPAISSVASTLQKWAIGEYLARI